MKIYLFIDSTLLLLLIILDFPPLITFILSSSYIKIVSLIIGLLSHIWGYDFYGDDRTVDTHVKTLRKHLGKYKDMIVTVRGMGYKFLYEE